MYWVILSFLVFILTVLIFYKIINFFEYLQGNAADG